MGRHRNSAPNDLLRHVQRPPVLLRAQSSRLQAEYFYGLSQSLQWVKPEEVGLERLLDARIAAARRSTLLGRAAEMRAVRSVVAGLHTLGNEKAPEEAWKTRKRARQYVARRLEPLATQAAARGDWEAALEAFRALEETGAMPPHLLRTYARILRKTEAASHPNTLRIYIQCLEQQGWQTARDSLLEDLQNELSTHLRIDENTPLHQLEMRMALIARMQTGGGNLNGPAKSLGLGYLLMGQPERARHYLERAAELDGHDNGETFYFLAQSLYRTGEYEKAANAFDQAKERKYPPSRIAAWQGLALAKSGQYAAAYELFRLAEQNLGPEADGAFFLYWGRTCYRMGAIDEAKMRFQQAIDKLREKKGDPPGVVVDRVRAHFGLAVCLVQQGNTDEAISLLQNVLRMREGFAPASHLLGWLFEMQKQRGRAVPYYRAAVDANPGDLVYLLSLGLALEHDQNNDAFPLLTRVAEGGKGGAEVMRRLAMGYRRKGDQKMARAWFQHLAAALPADVDCLRWVARFKATEATESFNRGAFAEAVGLWEQVFAAWPDGTVIERLGLALLCDASGRLKSEWNRDLQSVWPQIARAHQLAPCWDSRYLNALALLVAGEYQASHAEFAALDDGAQDRPTVKFLAILARYLRGEDGAASEFDTLGPLPGLEGLNVLVGLLQIQAAAQGGDFKLAAQRMEAWVNIPDCVQVVGSNRSEVNALVWFCLKQAGWRTGKFSNFIGELRSRDGDFWKPVLAVARALEVFRTRPGEADPARLEQCEQMFQEAVESLPKPEQGPLLAEYANFLRYRIEDAVRRGDLVLAGSLLDRLETTAGAGSPATAHLRAVLDQRLHVPSHEKAYTLIERDPEAACSIWQERLRLHPGEHASLEHLACLAWTRGYDAVRRADEACARAGQTKQAAERKQLEEAAAQDYEAAITFFVDGLGYFRDLYADQNYWDNLRAKGRLLVNPGNPFDEAGFDKWRSSALQDQASTLVKFAVHVANQDKKGGQARAKSAVAKLRKCALPKGIVEALTDEFAGKFLDRDPEAVPVEQFEAAMARAERVLQMDPDNTRALDFIIRGHTYRAETSVNEEADVVAGRISAVRPRAERLEKQMPNFDEPKKAKAKRNLAGFWETLGRRAKNKAGELVDEGNTTHHFSRSQLLDIRKWVEESNDAFEHAIKLDSTISLRTAQIQENNNDLLEQVRRNL